MEIDFSSLLEQSRALRTKQEASASASAFGDNIPSLERALAQIDRDSRRLASRAAAPSDDRAIRLLAAHGVPADRGQRELQAATLHRAFAPARPIPPTDLSSLLRDRRQLALAAAIDASVQQISSRARDAVQASLDDDWDRQKRLLVAMPALTARASSAPSPPSVRTAVPGGAFASPFRHPRAVRRSLDRHAPAATIYEAIVRRAVLARANPTVTVAVATELDDALVANLVPRGDLALASKRVQHLHAVFTALRYIVGEERPSPPSEAAFSGMRDPAARRQVAIGALRFLTLQFREDKMRREIETRPVEARRGGVPGLKADVRSYLNLVFDRGVPEQIAAGPSHDGMPLWAQVYYSLRAGDPNTSLDILVAALENEGCTDPCVELYMECLEAFVASGDKRMLPHPLLEKLVQDYWLSAKNSEDPYKRVCYVVLARLDPAAGHKMSLPDEDYSLLFYSIEDYLWLRLSVVHIEGDGKLPDSLATYQLSLSSIREEMKSFGPSHFDPQGDTPVFYALVLLLTGQFADAITYLDQGARAIAEATHIAFTLYHYGILRESMGKKADEGDREAGCYLVEYSELLWRYVSHFSRSDSTAAAVYMFTIRERELRNELLKKLILESKDFEKLLGSAAATTKTMTPISRFSHHQEERSMGALEELWPLGGRDAMADHDWLSVVESAAEAADRAGDREIALKLYDVAGVEEKVVAIHINRLSSVLTSRGSPSRRKVFDHAKAYRARIEQRKAMSSGMSHGSTVLQATLPSFDVLLSLGQFFDLHWEKKFEQARDLLNSLGVLPKNDSELVAKTQELKMGGGVWADAVCDRVPDVLLAGMEVLASLHAKSRSAGGVNGGGGSVSHEGRSMSVAGLRSAARTLVNFSGMMANASPDISARVVRLEVLMSC